MGNAGCKQPKESGKAKDQQRSCIIRSRDTFQNVADQNRNAQLFHGERLVETNSLRFQLLGILFVYGNLSSGICVNIVIAGKPVGNQGNNVAVFGGCQVCTNGILVPVFF